ncbi:hypothetical protein pb186bvf_004351 [Paramecium bursaria]
MLCQSQKSSFKIQDPLYQFKGYKKGVLFKDTVNIFIWQQSIIIEKCDKIDLLITNRISFKYNERRLVSFCYQKGNKISEIYANHTELQKMLELISCKIAFASIKFHFEAIAVIGKGSSSSVFTVKEIPSGRLFASKSILKTYLNKEPFGYDAFYQEVTILNQLKADSFMQLHRVYESKTNYYLILDLINGDTLQQVMNQRKQLNKPFTGDEIQIIMKQLFRIVSELHSMNIMHRDLKPSNIMFMGNDFRGLRVVDFGLAQKVNEPMIFRRCGTPGYVAPEIFSSDYYNQQCDIFSLGCILYRLTSGLNIFDGKDQDEILKANRKFQLTLQVKDQKLQHFLEGMLRFDPQTRLTAEECLNHEYLNGFITDRQNFIGIDEKLESDDSKLVPESYQPSLIQRVSKTSQKTIFSQQSMQSFYTKEVYDVQQSLLYNHYLFYQINNCKFIQPKLRNFGDLCSGAAIAQLIFYLIDQEPIIEFEELHNWTVRLNMLKKSWALIESQILEQEKPNFLGIAKNQDEQCALDLVYILAYRLFYGVLHSDLKDRFLPEMMNLDHDLQMILIQMIEECMPQNEQNLDKIQREDMVVNKIEEMEQENIKLQQEIVQLKQVNEIEKSALQTKLDNLAQENENLQKIVKQQGDEINNIYDVVSVSSIEELQECFNSRNLEIRQLQTINQQLRQDIKQSQTVNDEIVRDLRKQIDSFQRKLQKMSQVEKYAEQMKTSYQDSQQENIRLREVEKQNKKMKELNEELTNKLTQLQQKLDQQKAIYKKAIEQQNQSDFEMQKIRSDFESTQRQLKRRDQELFKLKSELREVEGMFHKTEHSQFENSSYIDGDDRRNISGIFSPKRNLGLELSQLISKSQCFENNEQKLKHDVHTQTDIYVAEKVIMKEPVLDDDFYQSQIDFWKTKCNDLVIQKSQLEEANKLQLEDLHELQQRVEQFFTEQNKYEVELQQAKDVINQFHEDIESQKKVESKLGQENIQLKQCYDEVLKKMKSLEDNGTKKKKVPPSQNQIQSKQIEILKRNYEEQLQEKQQLLLLLYGSFTDKFIGQAVRYVYVFETHMVINKEPNKKKADRLFQPSHTKRVIWKYTTEKPNKLRALALDSNDQLNEYMGDEAVLQELKNYLKKLFFQARVQDEYLALQVIGQGNYALVLELKHLHSDRKYAAKCIDKKKLETIENGMDSVINEILIMRQLGNHNRLVNLHEVYEGDNNIYLIMDLAEGGSLYSEMKNKNNLYSRASVQLIMKQILDGLNYMHSKNIMHRDLKPENILFIQKDDISTLKIADFGLATIQDNYPYLYPKCGTPGFVAPCIANLVDKQSQYSVRCDIFSAGVIFHILLLGEGLFNGHGHVEILRQNKQCIIEPNHKRYSKIDSDAKDLLFKMLEKDPSLRINAMQCLDHPYFYADEAPPLVKQHSSPMKLEYDRNMFAPESPSIILQRRSSKRESLVTRTPLYAPRTSQPLLLNAQEIIQENEISRFSLDQLNFETQEDIVTK